MHLLLSSAEADMKLRSLGKSTQILYLNKSNTTVYNTPLQVKVLLLKPYVKLQKLYQQHVLQVWKVIIMQQSSPFKSYMIYIITADLFTDVKSESVIIVVK